MLGDPSERVSSVGAARTATHGKQVASAPPDRAESKNGKYSWFARNAAASVPDVNSGTDRPHSAVGARPPGTGGRCLVSTGRQGGSVLCVALRAHGNRPTRAS